MSSGDYFSEDRKLETERKILEPRPGKEVVRVVSQIYDRLSPTSACQFTNPNVVLAIAGLKPWADIPFIQFNEDDLPKVEEINHLLKADGVRIDSDKDTRSGKISKIYLESLRGYQREAWLTKIPGVQIVFMDDNFEGVGSWFNNFVSQLEKTKEDGKLPKDADVIGIAWGMLHGYPDQAILDFEDCVNTTEYPGSLVTPDLKYPEYYKTHSAVPDFDLYPEHLLDREVVEYLRLSRQVVRDFYGSEWFKEIEKTSEFQEGRKAAEKIAEIGKEQVRKKSDGGEPSR